MNDTTKFNVNKKLLNELANNGFCLRVKVPPQEIHKYKDNPEYVIDSDGYLYDFDDLVNTRILLGIFKCVNFMKNVLVAGLVCGGIGVLILAISLIGK